jgi:hypothetical protein
MDVVDELDQVTAVEHPVLKTELEIAVEHRLDIEDLERVVEGDRFRSGDERLADQFVRLKQGKEEKDLRDAPDEDARPFLPGGNLGEASSGGRNDDRSAILPLVVALDDPTIGHYQPRSVLRVIRMGWEYSAAICSGVMPRRAMPALYFSA